MGSYALSRHLWCFCGVWCPWLSSWLEFIPGSFPGCSSWLTNQSVLETCWQMSMADRQVSGVGRCLRKCLAGYGARAPYKDPSCLVRASCYHSEGVWPSTANWDLIFQTETEVSYLDCGSSLDCGSFLDSGPGIVLSVLRDEAHCRKINLWHLNITGQRSQPRRSGEKRMNALGLATPNQ